MSWVGSTHVTAMFCMDFEPSRLNLERAALAALLPQEPQQRPASLFIGRWFFI